jgi:peptide/nickel transport system ATP-binding protein
MSEVLRIENLTKRYISGFVLTKKVVGAENVSFSIGKGEVLSLVGESGSGKTTVSKMILRLIKPTSGKIYLNGKDICAYDIENYYKKVQAIFQDPYTSFNPHYTVNKVLKDAASFIKMGSSDKSKSKEDAAFRSSLETIGLAADEVLGRYPYELSGGQMQRVLIARCLLIGPELLVADEVTSMIDASTRVAVLNELSRLAKEEKMAMLFITHDIGQAYYISDKVAIMEKGRIVEIGSTENVLFEPESSYAKQLVASVPKLHEKWELGLESIHPVD